MYTIKKILNNNVVIGLSSSREEVVLVGSGIGFEFKKGMLIPGERVTTVFTKREEELNNNYENILRNIDTAIVGISEEIISFWEEKLKIKLNNAIHISLPDHINFALKRLKSGVKIENPFIMELKIMFPNEFELSSNALKMINSRFDVSFPDDEIGFICLHLRAALTEEGVNTSASYMRKISEIMKFISKLLRKDLNKNSFEYIRTVSHINFMYERIKYEKPIKNYLLDSIKNELYIEFNMALKVGLKFGNLFNVEVPEDEIGYIALHLRRLKEIEGDKSE
ncbi:PRD domain-containing protein [Clostridium sediminicola]|uniref:PRD domain-containing protein n=1 Tax=Clostridium sediminicola TaxID=3114879 RepID=UPI0031F1D569